MKKAIVAMLGIAAVGLAGRAELRGQARAPRPPRTATPRAAVPMPVGAQNRIVSANCSTCHDDESKTGGLSLQDFDAAKIQQNPDLAEKMIRKLRAGMMPPPTVTDRPDAAMLTAFAAALETRIDQAAAEHPDPGSRPFQRLNRAEYANAIRDLLTLDVDVTAFLPADTISHGFDNVADTQSFSPALLEGYLRAASQISRLAVGDRGATASAATFSVPENASQLGHVEGAPYGTRGGISVVHTFPADGNYVFKAELHRTSTGELFGNTMLSISRQNEPIEISVNGERVALLDVSPKMSEADENGLTLETPPIHMRAGPQRISAAFIQRFAGPVDDLLAPIDHTLADSRIGTGFGITALPRLQSLTVTGPFNVTGVSDTPSRRRMFSCRPTTSGEEPACAAAILERLATRAYRGPVGPDDFADLMRFHEQGRKGGDFESGIRLALHKCVSC
jgi:cytochrome c551/c552